MNELLRTMYLHLVNPSTPETFKNRLDALVEATIGAIRGDPCPEAIGCFNALFPTRACHKLYLNRVPEYEFVGDAQLAHLAFCTASIFHKLSQEQQPTDKNKHLHVIGWEGGLNKDGKGWCKAMLLCEIPGVSNSFPESAVNDLLRAKWEILQIVRDNLPVAPMIPVSPLDHPRNIGPQDTMIGDFDS